MHHLRLGIPLGVAAGAFVLALAPGASAQELRYTTTARGGIIAIGNTLGLAKQIDANGPGVQDSIGTFISLDAASVDAVPANAGNPWPAGTTNDWHENGSTAVLTLPVESQVLYAELVWGGSTKYETEDVTALLNTPVTLTAGNATQTITPDAMTALTIAETAATAFEANYYMRSADVTTFVQTNGTATYSVEGVPATQATNTDSLNAAGWTMVVVYRDEGQPTRNLTLFLGGSFVDEDSQQDYTLTGFCTPPSGVVEGHVVVSTIEGDADLGGDQLLIAPTVADTFVNLSAPNNPATNFFCSQINDSAGQLDTLGTFGTVNHDAANVTNVKGARQGWDVTTVPLSSDDGQLENAQTSAVLRTTTTGDSFVPMLAAFSIDVNAPDLTQTGYELLTSAEIVTLGDELTITVQLSNQGQTVAQDVELKLALEAGLTLGSFEIDGTPGDANGQPVMSADLGTGVDIGDLAAGAMKTIVIVTDVTAPPAGVAFFLQAEYSYGFEVCAGDTPVEATFSQFALVDWEDPVGTGGAGGGGAAGVGGAGSGTGGGGASDATSSASATATASSSSSSTTTSTGQGGAGGSGSSDGDPHQVVEADGGCACAVPGSEPTRGESSRALAGLALAAAAWLRRRRSARARSNR